MCSLYKKNAEIALKVCFKNIFLDSFSIIFFFKLRVEGIVKSSENSSFTFPRMIDEFETQKVPYQAFFGC